MMAQQRKAADDIVVTELFDALSYEASLRWHVLLEARSDGTVVVHARRSDRGIWEDKADTYLIATNVDDLGDAIEVTRGKCAELNALEVSRSKHVDDAQRMIDVVRGRLR